MSYGRSVNGTQWPTFGRSGTPNPGVKLAPMSKNPMSTALVSNSLPVPSALGSLDAYISAVNMIPVLTVDEEQALARAYRDAEDVDAAKNLVMSHLRFVVHVA